MSEDQTTQAEPASTAVAVQPKREILVTHSERAVWDTADFQHMGRVATVMAESGLLPASFRIGKAKDENNREIEVELPRPQVVASALVLCTIAREMEANPFLLMQSASLISGKIMLEGKVISAAIEHRTGIRLRYVFGLWDTDHFVAVAETEELHGAGERLAVRVSGRFPDEDFDRVVEGSVGQWKTTRTGSPWSSPNDWPRQLRYRGAREWGRAHAPGVTLGMFGDGDDVDGEIGEVQRKPREKRDLTGKLANGKAGETPQEAGDGPQGFDRAHVAANLGDAPTGDAGAGGEVIECEHEFTGEGEERACEHCGQLEADARPTTAAGDTGTGGAPTAEAEPASSASAGDASEGSAGGEAVQEGHAAPGESYLLAGDKFVKDRRVTYKDGARFSTVGPQGAAKLKTYAAHAPEATAGEAGPEAEAEPQAQAQPEPQAEAAAQAEAPAADDSFLGRMRRETSWAAIKPILLELNKSSDFMAATDQEKDEVRAAVWAEVERVKADHDDKVDHALDVSAFSLWLATQGTSRDDADAIEGTFSVLVAQEIWGKLAGAAQDTLRQRVDAKLKSIRGGNG